MTYDTCVYVCKQCGKQQAGRAKEAITDLCPRCGGREGNDIREREELRLQCLADTRSLLRHLNLDRLALEHLKHLHYEITQIIKKQG